MPAATAARATAGQRVGGGRGDDDVHVGAGHEVAGVVDGPASWMLRGQRFRSLGLEVGRRHQPRPGQGAGAPAAGAAAAHEADPHRSPAGETRRKV